MHEVRRLIPTTREILTNGPFKIFVSVSLLALDSNHEARTSRVLKMSIERELVFSVEACVFIKNSPIVLASTKINYLPARLTFKNCKLEPIRKYF